MDPDTLHPRARRAVSPRNRRRAAGLTLIEMTLALSISGLVALGVASMLLAVSNGTNAGGERRTRVVRHKVLSSRIADAVRKSHRVLDSGTDYLVLWTADLDGSGTPDLAELRYLVRDTATNTLYEYQTEFPADWTDAQIAAANTAYALSADFGSIAEALVGDSLFPEERWATGVSGMTISLNADTPTQTTAVTFDIAFADDIGTSDLTFSASPRN